MLGPDPAEIEPRGGEGPRRDAFEDGLRTLARRERTTAELAAWLRERGYPEGEVEAAVGRLIEAGGLDDERFARAYAEDKRELSGWGAERIREALTARGISRITIERVVGAGAGEELERAIALLARRGERPVDDRSRARALAYLARRGYDSETAHDAVRGYECRAA